MTSYLVTYDLVHNASESAYEELISDLRRLNGHRAQKSVWLVLYNGTADALTNRLHAHMHDKEDRLLVVELKPNSSWESEYCFQGTRDWLKSNVGEPG